MEEIKYDIKQISELLNIKETTAKLYKRKGELYDRLLKIGYKVISTSKQGNKIIYHTIKEKDVEINYISKSKYGFIDLSDCTRESNRISWKKSIGKHIKGEYKNVKFDFEIIGFTTTKNGSLKLNILHNGIEKEMYGSDAKNFKGFDILLEIKSYDFLYKIGQNIKDKKRDFTIIDRKKEKDKNGHTWKMYKIHCNKCGFDSGENFLKGEHRDEYWIKESCIKNGVGCACCSCQFCVTGINDMWTTNPEIAKLLANKEDGFKYTFRASVNLDFKCKHCGTIINKSLPNVVKYGKVICNCGNGTSYPEKFMYSVLKQIGINFIWQYTKLNSEWCGKYRYDFYFNINNEEYIIETHGGQHYNNTFKCSNKSTEDIQQNDLDKYNLAILNGIKPENYIIIDCRKSDFNFIKNNILSSNINKIFDLNCIKWSKVNEYINSNIYKSICLEWDGEKTKESFNKLCEKFNCSNTMIKSALKTGYKYGWCKYDERR